MQRNYQNAVWVVLYSVVVKNCQHKPNTMKKHSCCRTTLYICEDKARQAASDFVRKQTRNKPQARQSELCLTAQAKLLVIGWAWQLEQVQASHACHGWASGMLPVGARQAASDWGSKQNAEQVASKAGSVGLGKKANAEQTASKAW